MISFRYHVVTILAVFLALAVGVALGGGPLSELGRGDDAVRDAEARSDRLQAELAAAQQADAFQDRFATGLGGRAVAGRLDGRSVSLLAMPGADTEILDSLTDLVKGAGGTVGGRYAVQPALVDHDGASLVDTLGAQLRQTVSGNDVPSSATAYDRLGGLLGRAIGAGSDQSGLDGASREILGSLEGAGLLAPEVQERRASIVIVVLGDEPGRPEDVDDVYAGLLSGLAAQPARVVLAGSTASADEGLLAVLRRLPEVSGVVSTVDSVQGAAGRVAVVLAAAASADVSPGHWGAHGNDGALPRG